MLQNASQVICFLSHVSGLTLLDYFYLTCTHLHFLKDFPTFSKIPNISLETCTLSSGSFHGRQPEMDRHGLPILPDKSKYKAVAMEYAQKMGWKRPLEQAQSTGMGYRATVHFGPNGQEQSASGQGLRQRNAIYAAYIELVPRVIPKRAAIELMLKWVPGFVKQEAVMTTAPNPGGTSMMKHPKSVLLEWAMKNNLAPPKTEFMEYADASRNLRVWTAIVKFCGRTVEARANKKKDAEQKCFTVLLNHVVNGGITRHSQ